MGGLGGFGGRGCGFGDIGLAVELFIHGCSSSGSGLFGGGLCLGSGAGGLFGGALRDIAGSLGCRLSSGFRLGPGLGGCIFAGLDYGAQLCAQFRALCAACLCGGGGGERGPVRGPVPSRLGP
ncbi:hypothetical protein [Paracoccus cavernae]|uniref:hypothetical protein n=1 Tax=Paracoccus cavernae TaxID=1571207 RepID=UPI00363AE6A4